MWRDTRCVVISYLFKAAIRTYDIKLFVQQLRKALGLVVASALLWLFKKPVAGGFIKRLLLLFLLNHYN
jgi:hypothetical protein